MRHGLAEGHRVVALVNGDPAAWAAQLAADDPRVEQALEGGQLELRAASEVYLADGSFDMEAMLAEVRAEHARAIRDGYPALSMTGEMGAALRVAPEEEFHEYERRLGGLMESGTLVFLCQYDHHSLGTHALSDLAGNHCVDGSPELAPIGREGDLAAARVSGHTVRISGELDFVCAQSLADVLDTHFHGERRFDLADVTFVDVAGMRALRGRPDRTLTITAASEPVQWLLALLAWDTDPRIEVL